MCESKFLQERGFTLIELIMFIIITSVLASTILLPFINSLNKAPIFLQNTIATETARQCMEWFIGQRSLNGYSSITCPSTAVPSFCTAPSGYSLSVNVSCTTISSDAGYQTITVSVNGSNTSSLTTLIGKY